MNSVLELFGRPTSVANEEWAGIVVEQQCPFLGKKCYKIRKSDPDTSIGSCTVIGGRPPGPIVICPTRLVGCGRIFADCLHLLTLHEPGNELHVVSEVRIPGGSVDFFLVSTREGQVEDFAGIEVQAMDTIGTVWPDRQRFLGSVGLPTEGGEEASSSRYGMNWKTTAKTTLVQLHHKIKTFENLGKKLALVLQNVSLRYMERKFDFAHVRHPAMNGHSMQFHSYRMDGEGDGSYRLTLDFRSSTDADGVARCLDLQVEAGIAEDEIIRSLQARIGPETVFDPIGLGSV